VPGCRPDGKAQLAIARDRRDTATLPPRDAWSRFLNRPVRLIDLHDDRCLTVGRAAEMRRSLLRCAVLAGPLTLPALAGCAPVGLVDQAFGLFGHSSPAASANPLTANIASANPVTTTPVGVSPLSASTTCANLANPNTASTNPTSADRGSSSIVSRVSGWFGHSSPTASVNTASTNPTSADSGSPSTVSQVSGLFGHPSSAASDNTASLNTASLNIASLNAASVNTASVNTANANPTSADSGSSSTFGWLSGLFGHRSSTAGVNPASTNPTSVDNGSASAVGLGTILSMRLVSATDHSRAAMGSVTNTMTGAHGGGAAPSLRIAGLGGGAMGMRSGTGVDGDGMAGNQTPQGTATGPATGQATEFTIRMDGGSTLIVVQGDSQGLLPGDQVQLIPGSPTRVARAE
jgi:outer membrane lipoprotein SlyB